VTRVSSGVRTLLLWCPDWPVTAAEIVEGVPAAEAVVVLRGNRVVACSEAARRDGVRRGLRRREAQSRCPHLIVVEYDPARDARAFEPVVAAVEEVAVGVEVIRPGACALAARGPSRYFGGEEAAAERIVEQVAEVCAVESQVGIAEGVFAAGLAARDGRLIPPGETASFLSGMPIEAIERPELIDLLKRLGIKTLGDFARLPAGDVLTRFGFDGALAHRLAAGHDHRPLAVRQPPPDLDVSETYDEPLERVDVAAFAGRALAEKLHEKLAAYGLACTRLGIEAVTADGQELHRVWRHDGTLTAAAIAERVRWQMDGWLTGARRGAPARPTAGLVRLRLIPDGVLVHLGLQPGLWGDTGAERERAHRAFSRVQGLLGPEAVVTPVLGGGRSADDQVRLVPWGDERTPWKPAADHADPVPDISVAPLLSKEAEAIQLTTRRTEVLRPAEADVAVEQRAWLERKVRKEERARTAESARETGEEWADAWARRTARAELKAQAEEGGREEGKEPAGRAVGGIRLEGNGRAVSGTRADGNGRAESGARVEEPKRGERGADVVALSRREEGDGRTGNGSVVRLDVPAPPPGEGGATVIALRPGGRRARRAAKAPLPPWPGRLPKPAPAVVLNEPLPAVVLDADGRPVGVSARLELTGEPAALVVERSQPVEIGGWAGPWPVDERWWAPGEARRRARFQVVLADGRALLLSLAGGHWVVEAIYD
jgi:protein ImuB